MAGTRCPGFSDFEKAEIWRSWKSGKTLNSIGRALDRAGPHVRDLVAASNTKRRTPAASDRLFFHWIVTMSLCRYANEPVITSNLSQPGRVTVR